MAKIFAAYSHALAIHGASESDEPGEKDNKGEEHDAHHPKEENEVHPEHPVQIHGQLVVGIDVQPISSMAPETKDPEAAKKADEPAAPPHALRCFKPVLDCGLDRFFVVVLSLIILFQVPLAPVAMISVRAAFGTMSKNPLDLRFRTFSQRHGTRDARVPDKHGFKTRK
jgi:hypothetical protein